MKKKTGSAQSLLKANQQSAHAAAVLTDTGNGFMEDGHGAQALECFQAVLELLNNTHARRDKRTAISHYNLARALAAVGRNQDAIGHYRSAIQHHPRFPQANNNLGMLLNEIGQFEEAVECFKAAISADSLFASAHYGLGVAYQNLGDNTNATLCYQKAINLNPDFYPSWANLGLLCYQTGNPEVAVHCYNEAIGLCPGNAELYFLLGLAFMAQVNLADASRAFTKALEFEPDHQGAKDALEEAMYFKLRGVTTPEPEQSVNLENH